MLENVFRTILSMSIISSIVAIVICLFRFSLGKRLPKKFSYYLWFIVLIRLIIPLNFTSNLSLFNYMPNTTTVIDYVSEPRIETETTERPRDEVVMADNSQPTLHTTINTTDNSRITSPLEVGIFMLSILWILGLALLIMQGMIKYYKASRLLDRAIIVKDISLGGLKEKVNLNRDISVYSYSGIHSPLVYGLIKPRIIVSTSMVETINTKETRQILTHELIHIKRFDNILKFIWSIVLCIHWFNPIIWLSAKYFNEDMELSCDEEVIHVWEEDIRKDYANSLITIGDKQNPALENSFIAFGKTNIKTRIKNIMNFKRPRGWVTLIGIILLIGIMIFTLTDKVDQAKIGQEENELLTPAYNGNIDGVEFGMNDPAEDVIEKLGEPIDIDYIYGGLYLQYEDMVFYTNGHIDDNKNYVHGIVRRIDVNESYGIKKGMTIDEVVEILGESDGQIIYDELREYGEGEVDPKMDYYTGDYTVSIVYDHNTKLVKYITLNDYRWHPDVGKNGFLELSNSEKENYNNFIVDFNQRQIQTNSPISIMKIWIHARMEENYEAEWELYSKEEKVLGWDKEEHMKMRKDGGRTDFTPFENPKNIKVSYWDDYNMASVSWEDKYLHEYDGFGNPFRYSFTLIRSEDSTYRVAFTPMQ